ncbi:unnamed protein product [Camellia sinensis]
MGEKVNAVKGGMKDGGRSVVDLDCSIVLVPDKEKDEGTPVRAIFCLKNNINMREIEEREDCFILDFDPDDCFDLSKLSMSKDLYHNPDLSVLAEKGQWHVEIIHIQGISASTIPLRRLPTKATVNSATVLFVTKLPLANIGLNMGIAMPLTTKHGGLQGRQRDNRTDEIK